MYEPSSKTKLTTEQVNAFEKTELRGVLPSIDFLIEHLSQFGDQFDLTVKHLNNAGTSLYKTAVQS